MSDLIDRQAAIATAISGRVRTENGEKWIRVSEVRDSLLILSHVQQEPLTDKEQRIFLAAMGREEKVCKNIDEELPGPYKDSLFKACKEIERKVKKTLWTN